MRTTPQGVLVLCYGNPSRLDDAIGAVFARALEQSVPDGVTVETDYQLSVEHALKIADHEIVIFVDAAVSGPEPFAFRRVHPKFGASFTTHSIEPESLMGLARELFDAKAQGYTLGIRGYEFDDFGESLSPSARANLDAAVGFVLELLGSRRFEESARVFDSPPTHPC